MIKSKIRDNKEILETRVEAWNKIKSIRVGDFIYTMEGKLKRIAHVYPGDAIQPSQGNGSFYLGHGYMSYSGALENSIPLDQIELTGELMEGDCWFFDKDIGGVGRGKNFIVLCRVYKVKGE